MQHTHDVRRRFIDYFRQQGHTAIASSPVAPLDDPSLLFTNAGMNQFKDVFLGKSARDYTRAVTSQKCIRVGGKHNDLENVGHTTRHLTFFEMLGNFSFGDYFKDKAIEFAWEVATTIFKFDPKVIWISVYEKDDEAYTLWTRYVPESRIVRIGEKDNFWSMGDTGPCGPCSELFYDKGPEFGSATDPSNDTAGERFLEFWNLVFMQYNRLPNGTLEPLPKPSIDTGAGLERVMSLIQGKESVFETDVLRSIIASIEELCQITYNPHDKLSSAFRVIADHLRCLCFAIADGVQPSNVERGYVLRKVLRRAVRYGKMLGFEKPFLAELLPRFIEIMGKDYKELILASERIADILTQEEEAFFRTLKRGGNMLNKIIDSSKEHSNKISGIDAFTLKDTYGLPLEEILLIAKDYDLEVDVQEFEALEKKAKEKSRAAQKSTSQVVEESLYTNFVQQHGECVFARDSWAPISGKVIGIVSGGQFIDALEEGQEGMIILDKTNFYAEMGGQVGDSGELTGDTNCFSVSSCSSPFKGVIAHTGKQTQGRIALGDQLSATINTQRRQKIANNHTATHLLHWALHQVLGEHTKQAGSIVDEFRLRFDFNHHKALSEEEIRTIELMVNEKIQQNFAVSAYELPYEEAQKRHDIFQFFGEKYGKVVRVIDINFSKELCGGTHTSHTGTIGYFRISEESSIAAGVRRIEAVTGQAAENFAYRSDDTINRLADHLKTPQSKVTERVEKLSEEVKNLKQELKQLQKDRRLQIASALPISVTDSGTKFCIAEVSLPVAEARLLLDELNPKIPSGIIALGCKDSEKAHIFVKISQDFVSKGFKANEFIKPALEVIEGSGGGKAESAQGAGKSVGKLHQAIEKLKMQLT